MSPNMLRRLSQFRNGQALAGPDMYSSTWIYGWRPHYRCLLRLFVQVQQFDRAYE